MKVQKQNSNTIEALESDYLYVGLSQLPDSVNGLFTAINIYKNEVISLFKEEILTEAQAKLRAKKAGYKYFINMIDGSIMDSMRVKYLLNMLMMPKVFRNQNLKIVLKFHLLKMIMVALLLPVT